VDINAAGGSDAGLSIEKIDALPHYAESDLYTPAEKAALELADAMSQVSVQVSDELYGRLRSFYNEAELVDLAGIIALENFRSRFNRVFEVEAQGLYCPVPERS